MRALRLSAPHALNEKGCPSEGTTLRGLEAPELRLAAPRRAFQNYAQVVVMLAIPVVFTLVIGNMSGLRCDWRHVREEREKLKTMMYLFFANVSPIL